MEREWREAIDMRSSALSVALVVLSGAALRFWALGHGIPYAVGVDEPEIVTRAVTMMKTGDFNPHFFDYPGLYIYVQAVVATLRFLVGAMDGLWRSLAEAEPEAFYLWGRAVTAALGTATVLLVFQIGTRWGARHALLAAGLMAVLPSHVRESHYVLTDVPMTFFTTLTFLLTLRADERNTNGAFAWAGAAAGLAAATKYNGLLVVVLPLIAVLMAPAPVDGTRTKRGLIVAGACVGTFLGAAPYTLLDLPGFLEGFANLSASYSPRPRVGEPGWLTYLKHLRITLQWPTLILALSGLVLATVRASTGPGHLRWVLLLAFPLLYFYFIATKNQIYGRYLLPILPFACLLASCAVISGVTQLRRFDIPRAPRTALITLLTVAALFPVAKESISFDRRIGKQSTQAIAYDWIHEHVPEGSKIAIETRVMRLPGRRYDVQHFPRLILNEFEDYASRGYGYFVASSQSFGPVFDAPQSHPEEYAAYQRLMERSEQLMVIEATGDHPGPELRVYRLRP